MRIVLTLTDVQELNRIRHLLESPDPGNQQLGVTLFKTHRVLAENFYDMAFISSSHKEIPVRWYFDKVDAHFNQQNQTGYCMPASSLIPMLDAIVTGENNRFKAKIYYEFDHRFPEE